jgi:large subunit ribosomal protein L21
MQAVISVGGTQQTVKKGDVIVANKVEGDVGATIEFDVVALIKGDAVTLGTPVVKGAKVVAKISKQGRGEKITVGKYKRRKGYHKKQGHRQSITTLSIESVN